MKEEIIRLEGVALGYGRKRVLDGLNFGVRPGESLGVIGPNGAGKTTLLRGLLGLIRPMAGEIRRREGLRFGYVIQRQFLDTSFPFTVLDIVRMGTLGCRGATTRGRRAAGQALRQAMEICGMWEIREALYREISGGQRQRALIARALVARPDVLLLDEPTNDMDMSGEERIMGLVEDVRQETGATVLLVSHLLHVVLNHVERLLFLTEREACIHPVEDLLSGDLLSGIYGCPVRVGTANGKRYLVTGS